MKEDRRIDELLARHFDAASKPDEAAVARVLTALARPLPRQKSGLFGSLPELLLDWQFAPAWPRVAALACCAALGLLIGFSGLDRSIDGLSAEAAQAPSFASAVFEPEPLTGIRP
ncbi:MAG TPA: hypothetical protein VFL51_00625 [Pseudolabrys sp.]|nr:hypothetical protein [Pseudolabrys sp.]